MGERINNIGTMLKNPKQRNIYLTTIGLAIIIIIAGIFYVISGNNKENLSQGGAKVAEIPDVQAIPGTSTSARYNESVSEANKKDAEEALKNDASFIPTVTNEVISNESPLDALEKEIKAQKKDDTKEIVEEGPESTQVVDATSQSNITTSNITTTPYVYVAPVSQAQIQPQHQKTKKYGTDEDYLLLTVLTDLSKIKESRSEFNYSGQTINTSSQSTNNNQLIDQQSQQQLQNNTVKKGTLIAKAGTIFNAILETGINSDEPSPILAKIVSGDLKGTRLIGNLSITGEKVVVQFNTASIPGVEHSVRINSVAIDPMTSRTALASNVNRHYLARYGLLLASAFLGAYADAIKNKNAVTTITPHGSIIVTQGSKKSSDIYKEAIGGAGKELANEARNNISGMKPTITVDAGIPIGILLMEDLYLEK